MQSYGVELRKSQQNQQVVSQAIEHPDNASPDRTEEQRRVKTTMPGPRAAKHQAGTKSNKSRRVTPQDFPNASKRLDSEIAFEPSSTVLPPGSYAASYSTQTNH